MPPKDIKLIKTKIKNKNALKTLVYAYLILENCIMAHNTKLVKTLKLHLPSDPVFN